MIGVTANDARSVFCVAFSAFFICVQLAPLSVERHTPPLTLFGQTLLDGNGAAYTMLAELGSSATSWTPRVEPKLAWMIPALTRKVRIQANVLELSNVKFAPPSVDFQKPYGGSPGASVTAPPLKTELMPRTARTEPT